MTPDGKLPMWTLSGGSGAVHQVFVKFYSTRMQDQKNEGFPTMSRRLSQKTKQSLGIQGKEH